MRHTIKIEADLKTNVIVETSKEQLISALYSAYGFSKSCYVRNEKSMRR